MEIYSTDKRGSSHFVPLRLTRQDKPPGILGKTQNTGEISGNRLRNYAG